ncbi:Protein FAF1 [Wallemia ichthyophaga EXF-994]|uniref:Protein FAF1 n=1 Tax=Wallemia ichthyophaga (strain EXF-994 / CBS 113033) TaxID=1299270 RepID=R9AXW1_WALI9|nr:Protein FAF1 [Wallemia ichthyophaga EXF-994]EOR04946.1 Protein FAF1 [Wallemia ichthyophaga EXF-994]
MSDDEDYQQAALKALEAHQKAFENQFAPPPSKSAREDQSSDDSHDSDNSDDGKSSDDNNDNDDGSIQSFDSDDDIIGSDTAAQVDDLFNVGKLKGKGKQKEDSAPRNAPNEPQVVVFGEQAGASAPSTRDRDSKRAQKAFMSSKVNKVQQGPSEGTKSKQRKPSQMSDADRSNIENDKELEQLLHSQLFTARENTKNMKAGDKMRMYEGRLLEIAGKADVGRGAAKLKKAEHKKASGVVRTGLEKHDKEMKVNELQHAKDLGVYDKSLKHLYEGAEGKSKATKRSFGSLNADRDNKRQKGLSMGVGKFKNGMLSISKAEIDSVNSQPKRRGK